MRQQEPLPHYSKRGDWSVWGGRCRQEEAPDVSVKKRWDGRKERSAGASDGQADGGSGGWGVKRKGLF